jgi:hypothetical protein
MPSSVQYAERMENLGLHSHSDDKQEYVQHLHLQISFPYQTTSDKEEVSEDHSLFIALIS